MPTVREYEAAMERNPSDTEAFVALRKAYRQAQKHDRLVTLYEARAQAIEDNAKAGELFYLAAELRIDQLGDAEGAEADLVNAVDRDPSHIRAAARLKDIYREQGRTADYMTMLEMEAAAVARTRDPARIAELEAEMSQLFLNHFARLERAVRNPQRTGKLAQEHVRSIESARKIYRALGDYRAVVRLYELELEGTQDARRRADLLLGLGRVLGEKLEELDAAAQRLAEVVRLRPRDEKALELLAGVYANPNWIGADGVDRAAAIYYQVARRRQEAGDTENAIAALRRALAAVPGHAGVVRAARARLLRRAPVPGAGSLLPRARVGRRRPSPSASTSSTSGRSSPEGELDDVAEAQRVYNEISLLEPPGGPASEKLVELYLAGQEYAKLAELRERQLGAIADPAAAGAHDAGAGRRCTAIGWAIAIRRPSTCTRCWRSSPRTSSRSAPTPNTSARRATGRRWPICWSSRSNARGWRASATDELLPRLEEIADGLREAGSATPSARSRPGSAPRRSRPPTAARARRSAGCCSRPRAGTAWRRCSSARPRAQTDPGAAHRDPAARGPDPPREAGERRRAPSRSTRRSCAPIRTDAVSMRAVVETYEREGDFVSLAQLLREQIDRRDVEAGARRPAAPRAGDLRRAHRRPAQGQWAAERDPAGGARAIATR